LENRENQIPKSTTEKLIIASFTSAESSSQKEFYKGALLVEIAIGTQRDFFVNKKT